MTIGRDPVLMLAAPESSGVPPVGRPLDTGPR
jgi:hypothetical protein